jgi:hypothetical protein
VRRILKHSKDVSDVFSKFSDPNYRLAPHESSALAEKRQNREKEAVLAFMVASQALLKLQPSLMKIQGTHDERLFVEISRLSKDETVLADLYAEVRSSLHSAENVDHNWALFRRTQAHLMMAMVYIRSYGDKPIEKICESARTYKRTANLYLDTEYLVFGALAGALATGDALLRRLFAIMCPDGKVVSLISMVKEID